MLPDVDCKQRHKVCSDVCWCVLVLRLPIFKQARALVVKQPAPTRALQNSSLFVENLNECIDRTPLVFYHLPQVARLVGDRAASLLDRRKSFPEKLVIQMATSIKLDSISEFNVLLEISGRKCFSRLHTESIQVVDISSVVLTVVEFHQVTADDRLECTDFVGQVF